MRVRVRGTRGVTLALSAALGAHLAPQELADARDLLAETLIPSLAGSVQDELVPLIFHSDILRTYNTYKNPMGHIQRVRAKILGEV